VSVIKRLGSGNFGHVDKAVATGLYGHSGQITVAVKTLKGEIWFVMLKLSMGVTEYK